MTACGNDFLVADDSNTVKAIIDSDILENDAEMLSEVNYVVKNLPSTNKSGQHHNRICSTLCLSESGLLRHVKLKHPEYLPPDEISNRTL